MAIATVTTNPSDIRATATRRRVIGLAAGSAVIAATGPAAAITADPLEALWHQYERLGRLFDEACDVESAAAKMARSKHPLRPRILFGRKHETGARFALSIGEITRWRDQSAAMGLPERELHERQLAAWHLWREACAAVDAQHGLTELEARSAALLDEITALEDAMAGTPTTSVRSVLIKLRLADKMGFEDDRAGSIVLGLISDLESAR